MMAMKRMSSLASMSPTHQAMSDKMKQYMEESEKEHVDEVRALSVFIPFMRLNVVVCHWQHGAVLQYSEHGSTEEEAYLHADSAKLADALARASLSEEVAAEERKAA